MQKARENEALRPSPKGRALLARSLERSASAEMPWREIIPVVVRRGSASTRKVFIQGEALRFWPAGNEALQAYPCQGKRFGLGN